MYRCRHTDAFVIEKAGDVVDAGYRLAIQGDEDVAAAHAGCVGGAAALNFDDADTARVRLPGTFGNGPRDRRLMAASAEGMLDICKLRQVVACSAKSPVGRCLGTRLRGYDDGAWSMTEPNRFNYCAECP